MKNLLAVMIFIFAVAGIGGVQAKETDFLRIAVDVPYKPFGYKKPDGTLTGFEVELGNEVCESIRVKCEWIIQAWDGIIPGLLARKYDVIMSSMSITKERARKVLFSNAYYNTPSAWFGKKSMASDNVSSKKILQGKMIGVQRGTLQDNHITDNFGNVVTVKRYTTADDMVLDLKTGRLDYIFIEFPVGEATILKDKEFVVVGERIQVGNGIGMAFRKRDKRLAEKFNRAMEKLKKDGTYDHIMKKYFSYSIKM